MAQRIRESTQHSAGGDYRCVFPRYKYIVKATDILRDKEIYYIINKTYQHKCIQIYDYNKYGNNKQPYIDSRNGTVVIYEKGGEGQFYEIDDSDRNSDIKTHIGSFTTPKKKEPNVVIDKDTIFATYDVYSKTEPVQGGKKSRKQRKSRKSRKQKKSRKSRK